MLQALLLNRRVAIKVQAPAATEAEVEVLRRMTDAACHTVAVLKTFSVSETESAFAMPLVPRAWDSGVTPASIRKRAHQLIEVRGL